MRWYTKLLIWLHKISLTSCILDVVDSWCESWNSGHFRAFLCTWQSFKKVRIGYLCCYYLPMGQHQLQIDFLCPGDFNMLISTLIPSSMKNIALHFLCLSTLDSWRLLKATFWKWEATFGHLRTLGHSPWYKKTHTLPTNQRSSKTPRTFALNILNTSQRKTNSATPKTKHPNGKDLYHGRTANLRSHTKKEEKQWGTTNELPGKFKGKYGSLGWLSYRRVIM